jgi:protein involved in polysaccharide export with SLBB domain
MMTDMTPARITILLACAALLLAPLHGLAQQAAASPAAYQTPADRQQPYSSANTVAFTTSMEVLNDVRKLGPGDRLSFRVVEDRKQPVQLVVTDSGEMEVPLIGRVQAASKTCKELAYELKSLFEKEYYYQATVILGLDSLSGRSPGRIYLMGQIRGQGAMELPGDEQLTVSKAILRAGGLGDFANRSKIRLIRKKSPDSSETETIIVNLNEILDKGRYDKDPVLMPGDVINVPERLVNF